MFAVAKILSPVTSTLARTSHSANHRYICRRCAPTSRNFLHTSFRPHTTPPTKRNENSWQTAYRQASQHQQRRSYRRQAFSYQRYQQTSGLFRRWAARPSFYYEIGGLGLACGGFYMYNLETVPVSGRRRFNLVSAEYEAEMGQSMYQQTMSEYGNRILPPHSREHRMVQRVLDRLVPRSGLQGESWEIHVIDAPEKNAFVVPGGKVFVFKGILEVCQDEDGLAAVLGHEIAHNVAHHAAERMSAAGILLPLAFVGSILLGIDPSMGQWAASFLFTLPHSRSQESEADYIGLLMMAESCYDPQGAVELWARMEKAEKGAPPQFLSTHPSSHNRQGKIRAWLPEAEVKRESGECGAMGSYVNDFKRITDTSSWHDVKA